MTSKKWQAVLLTLLVFTFSACSKNKTELVATLSDPTVNGPAIQRVVVFGVMNTGLNHHVYEDTFVDALRAKGVDAVPSHSLSCPNLKILAIKQNSWQLFRNRMLTMSFSRYLWINQELQTKLCAKVILDGNTGIIMTELGKVGLLP